uniref:Putative secreted protein n=1 Tax=Ixodes ricinus TaxID=34613 RepID=A0A6B0UK83_IXORI
MAADRAAAVGTMAAAIVTTGTVGIDTDRTTTPPNVTKIRAPGSARSCSSSRAPCPWRLRPRRRLRQPPPLHRPRPRRRRPSLAEHGRWTQRRERGRSRSAWPSSAKRRSASRS